jgi:HD-GYP domain-containing protein (c-di-GMP phosphodiesterase class II)
MIHDDLITRLEHLIEIGIALSAESDSVLLLEKILTSAKFLTNSDGGTLYSIQDDTAKMEIFRNDSLGIMRGGSSGHSIPFPPIQLYKEDGGPNFNNVVSYAVHHSATVNIVDSYDIEHFDFSGTRKFDAETGYRSISFLTIPLKNHEGEIIGVLQLLNSLDPQSGAVISFDPISQRLTEALASQAGIALTKKNLIENLKYLFQALVRLIAQAIDQKSPYTGAHCHRVPYITMLLAEAVHEHDEGLFKGFQMTEQDRYELELAGWLHDCGKITTPEYVIDKATKLETLFDRMHLVDTRFEILQRDAEIALLKEQLAAARGGIPVPTEAENNYRQVLERIEADRQFLRICNKGGEFMKLEDQERVRQVGQFSWEFQGVMTPFLSENEIYNLTIPKGTITPEERQIINNHINVTIDMLNALPFPKSLRHVPEYAGGHHERMDGKGYPKGLRREQLSVQARIMGIADIFEALTAKDRPYKPGKTLTEALMIMARMKATGHIDPDLFDIFVTKKVYQQYAEQFLDPEQIDVVDEGKILTESRIQ